jgi:hypothetical protein
MQSQGALYRKLLLFAEEESKRKMQQKTNVAKQKKQKKKAKKKGAPTERRASEPTNGSTDKHNDVEEDPPDVAAGCDSIVDAHGRTRTLKKPGKADISGHVLGRLHGGQDYRQSELPLRCVLGQFA